MSAPHSVGNRAEAGLYVLVGSYAASPFEWFICNVVYADPRLDEVCVRRFEPNGDAYLQVLPRETIRSVAKPSEWQLGEHEGDVMAASIAILVEFQHRACELWDRSDRNVQEAEQALEAARKAKWARLDSLYDESAAG